MNTAQKVESQDSVSSSVIADLLATIAPKHSPAFSANLYRWLRAHGRDGDTVYCLDAGGKLAGVFRAGTLFIGQPYADHAEDIDFSGSTLMGVLRQGTKATRRCYAGDSPSLIEVEGFWSKYKEIGRCAIDTKHAVAFIDEGTRFTQTDGQRTCHWCAATVPNACN